MARDLFISHSSADAEDAAALVIDLENRGISCWIAPRDVPMGSAYQEQIVEAVEDCRAMLLLFSEAANQSEHVLREVELAANARKPIYPLRIGDVLPAKGLKFLLANKQWIERKAIEGRLAETLEQLLRTGQALPPSPMPHPQSTSGKDRRNSPAAENRWRLMAAVAGIVALALFGYIAFRPIRESSMDTARAPEPSISAPSSATAPATSRVVEEKPNRDAAAPATLPPNRTDTAAVAAGPVPAAVARQAPEPPALDPVKTEPSPLAVAPGPAAPVPAAPAPQQQAFAEPPVPENVAASPVGVASSSRKAAAEPAAARPGLDVAVEPKSSTNVAVVAPETAAVVAPRIPSTIQDCVECPIVVTLPAGSFLIGSPPDEPGRRGNEGPRRLVRIAAGFAIGRSEVSFAEWDVCVADGGCRSYRPSDYGMGRGKSPVIFVSWDDAASYLAWLSAKTGFRYRLPSESEWEFAARACLGDACANEPFSFGAAVTPDLANYNWNTSYQGSPRRPPRRKTFPIHEGSEPNRFGLVNMHGNVAEWVQDCGGESYADLPLDGKPNLLDDCQSRIVRGGHWNDDPRALRSAARNWEEAGTRSPYIGFRVVRQLAD